MLAQLHLVYSEYVYTMIGDIVLTSVDTQAWMASDVTRNAQRSLSIKLISSQICFQLRFRIKVRRKSSILMMCLSKKE